MEYTLNTKHFREQIIASLDKATIRDLCFRKGIKVDTAADRKLMAKKLAERIEKASLVIEWDDFDYSNLTLKGNE